MVRRHNWVEIVYKNSQDGGPIQRIAKPADAVMLELSPPPPANSGLQAEREAFERILGAIAERSLPPGTKLTEESLVEIFGITRGRVRKVLLLLSQRGLI